MAKSDPEIVKEVLDRMVNQTNEAKAREIAKVLGKRIRSRARGRQGPRATAVPVRRRSGTQSYFSSPDVRSSQKNGSPLTATARYAPIRIDGEPLSATILADRGTY